MKNDKDTTDLMSMVNEDLISMRNMLDKIDCYVKCMAISSDPVICHHAASVLEALSYVADDSRRHIEGIEKKRTSHG